MRKDLGAAAATYATLEGSEDLRLRAEALMRLARVRRQQHATDQALGAYDALMSLDAVTVEGLPAALIARAGRMGLYGELGRVDDRSREAAALLLDLQARRCHVTKAVYDGYSAEARQWLTHAAADDLDGRSLADAASWLWQHREPSDTRGRRVLTHGPGVDAVESHRAAARCRARLLVVLARPKCRRISRCRRAMGARRRGRTRALGRSPGARTCRRARRRHR